MTQRGAEDKAIHYMPNILEPWKVLCTEVKPKYRTQDTTSVTCPFCKLFTITRDIQTTGENTGKVFF